MLKKIITLALCISFIFLFKAIVFASTDSAAYKDWIYPKAAYKTGITPSFSMEDVDKETINPATSELELKKTDLYLKGRNGLDFALTRYYSTSNAKMSDLAWQDSNQDGIYGEELYQFWANETYWDLGGGWQFDLPYAEAKGNTIYFHFGENGVFEIGTNSSGQYYIKDSLYIKKDIAYQTNEVRVSKPSSSISINCGPIGNVKVDYIFTQKDGKQYQFGVVGGFIRILSIKDRFENEIRFQYDRRNIPLLPNPTYVGPVQWIKCTKIVDSVGREINFDYQDSNNRIVVTVNDPNDSVNNNRTIIYNKVQISFKPNDYSKNNYSTYDSSYPNNVLPTPYYNMYLLDNVVDSENNITRYEYTADYITKASAVKKDFNCAVRIPQFLLSKVVYPTGGSTTYLYGTIDFRNFGPDGLLFTLKLSSRYESKPGTDKLNYKKFEYKVSGSQYEYDGFPIDYSDAYNHPEVDSNGTRWFYRYAEDIPFDLTTAKTRVTDGLGNTETYTYQGGYILCKDVLSQGADHKNEVSYIYDMTTKLPTKISQKKYNISTGQYMQIFENYLYDLYKNITGYWDNQNLRDTNGQPINDEHKTTYTYNYLYNLLTSKIYKKDIETTVTEEYTLNQLCNNVDMKKVYEKVYENNVVKEQSQYTYDIFGNIITQKNYMDNWINYIQTNFSYDDNVTTRSVKINGAYLTRKWVDGVKDADGNLLTPKAGNTPGTIDETYEYDWFGNLTKKIDGEGNPISYKYDKLNRLTKQINSDNTSKINTYSISSTYNIVISQDEKGNLKRFDYDPFGNLTSVTEIYSSACLYTATYIENRLRTETTYLSTTQSAITTYDYYLDGRAKSKETKEQSGKLVSLETYTYDDAYNNGQYYKVLKTRTGDASSPTQNAIIYVNKNGQVEKEGAIHDGAELVMTYAYDYVGNKTGEKDARANSEAWGQQYTYEYNYAGKLTKTTNILSQSTTTVYDALGRAIQTMDYKGNTTKFSYDNMGRIIEEDLPFQTGAGSIKKHYYNRNGSLIKEKVTDNKPGEATHYRQEVYVYNSRELLTEVITYNADGNPENYTQYYYDEIGNKKRMYTGLSAELTITGLDQVTEGADKQYSTTKYDYDKFNNLANKIDPSGKAETYTYDLAGHINKKIDRMNSTNLYTVDDAGRMKMLDVSTVDGQGNVTHNYTYTITGLRKTMEGITYTYDDMGRLINEIEGATEKSYTYDSNNNRKSFVVKQNGVEKENITYEYDNMNRLWHVSENGQLVATYTYDANGNRDTLTYGNGVNTKYDYNNANQLIHLTNRRSDGTVLSQYDYTYYLDGNQAQKTETGKGATQYKYDGLGRLDTTTEPDGTTRRYRYDDANNRTSYIISGNIYIPENVQGINYSYDGLGRLKTAIIGTNSATYNYNGDGIRTSKTVNGTTTEFVLDSGNVVLEPNNGITIKYIRGINLIASQIGGIRYYYLYNGHGDVVQITDAAGNVVNSYSYDEWGNTTSQSEIVFNPFKYCGEYFDKETGTIYLRARYYDPEIGRFITEDSYWGRDRDPLSLNLYTYCHDNPILYTDPSGHMVPVPDYFYKDALDFFIGAGSGILETYSYGVSDSGEDYYLRNNESTYLAGKLVGNFLGGLGGVIEVGAGGAYTVGTGGVGAVAGGAVVVGHGATVVGSSYGCFSANYIKLAQNNNNQSKSNSGTTKNTKTKWDIKTNASDKVDYNINGQKVSAYQDPKTGFYWSRDTEGHGGSAFKVFKMRKGGKELEWVSDADEYGNFITDKYKGSTGLVVKVK